MARGIPPSLEDTLRRYREALDNAFGERVVSVRLFGSQARGDAEPGSDADIVIIVDQIRESERVRAIDLAFDAWRQAGRAGPVPAVLVWTPEELADRLRRQRRLALDVEREGIAF